MCFLPNLLKLQAINSIIVTFDNKRRKHMKLGKCAAALVVTSFLLTGCQNGSKTVKEDDNS